MNGIINVFINFLGCIINWIYTICNNYGITILIFTILSKVIMFPINILIQKNSIKMVKMKPKIEELKLKYKDNKDAFMEAQMDLYEKEKYHPTVGIIPLLLQIPIILGLIEVISNSQTYINNIKNTYFLGIDLAVIPTIQNYVVIPILAGISTVLLCVFQNRLNVLQKEEGIYNKLITGGITVGITVYFIFLVPTGVGIYWIVGNLLSIIQLYVLNWIFPPKKYIDYEALEKLKNIKKEENKKRKQTRKKSKYYYKKFFEEENISKVKLVFFAEQSGFYKYYKGMIEYILNNSDIVIHYITTDINDKIFEMKNERIIPYFIDTKELIPLFMKLECDIIVMTTPELQNYYLKRSIIKKDIEYIFTDHGLGSENLLYRADALAHYDTIFVKNLKQEQEIRAIEKKWNFKPKNLLRTGYTLLEDMIKDYEENKVENTIKTIVIAPSWQEDNIMDCCIDEIIEGLLKTDYKILVRPHPQYIKTQPDKIQAFIDKYEKCFSDRFILEKDFSSNSTIYNADLVITDWSSIGYEFSFSTTKPCLYVNTKMKILNKDYKLIDVVPLDLEVRDKIGRSIDLKEINNIVQYIDDLILNQEEYKKKNLSLRDENVFNLGYADKIEGEYIINKLKEKGK